jgi:hypothetical protein
MGVSIFTTSRPLSQPRHALATRFLNYTTDRRFRQRIGDRYRFIHTLLQDHFAAMRGCR